MDVISLLASAARLEPARLIFVGATPAYDPNVETAYDPGEPQTLDILGIIGRGGIDALPAGAKSSFTFPATAVPDGLAPMKTQLLWGGRTEIVHSWRERHSEGRVNCVTLYLAA